MKKILLLISILTLILTGCTFKMNVQDEQNDNEIIQSGEVSDNVIEENIEIQEDEILEKYKISDDYTIDFNNWKEVEYNLFQQDKVINEELTQLVSDNTNIKLKFEVKETEYNWVPELKIYVNDIYHTTYGKYGSALFNVALIDLDEEDIYKEILISKTYGMDADYEVYRIKKDGLELIRKTNLLYNESTKQYIGGFNEVIDGVGPTPILGYYIYDAGEFKYIDRFPNGEKIVDENGYFNETFQKEVFTVGIETHGFNLDESDIYKLGMDLYSLARAKVKFIRMVDNINEYGYNIPKYDIEIAEDYIATYYDENDERQETTIPAGTIIKGVTAWSNAGGTYYNLVYSKEYLENNKIENVEQITYLDLTKDKLIEVLKQNDMIAIDEKNNISVTSLKYGSYELGKIKIGESSYDTINLVIEEGNLKITLASKYFDEKDMNLEMFEILSDIESTLNSVDTLNIKVTIYKDYIFVHEEVSAWNDFKYLEIYNGNLEKVYVTGLEKEYEFVDDKIKYSTYEIITDTERDTYKISEEYNMYRQDYEIIIQGEMLKISKAKADYSDCIFEAQVP